MAFNSDGNDGGRWGLNEEDLGVDGGFFKGSDEGSNSDDFANELEISRDTGVGGRSLASLSVVDGGLEVDLGEATLQIHSAGNIDINVREGSPMTKRLPHSSGVRRVRSSSAKYSTGSTNSGRSAKAGPGSAAGLDEFLQQQGFDTSAIEGDAVRTAVSFGADLGNEEDLDEDDDGIYGDMHNEDEDDADDEDDRDEELEDEVAVDFGKLLQMDEDASAMDGDLSQDAHIDSRSRTHHAHAGKSVDSLRTSLLGRSNDSLNTSLEARLKRLEVLLEGEANTSLEASQVSIQNTAVRGRTAVQGGKSSVRQEVVDLSETNASLEARMQRLNKLLQNTEGEDEDDSEFLSGAVRGDFDDYIAEGDGEPNDSEEAEGEEEDAFQVHGESDHMYRNEDNHEDDAEQDEEENLEFSSSTFEPTVPGEVQGNGRYSPNRLRSTPGGRRSESGLDRTPASTTPGRGGVGRDESMGSEEGLGFDALDRRMRDDDTFERMNRALQQAGFHAIPMRGSGGLDADALFSEVRDLLAQYNRRGEMIRELTMEESSSRRTDEEAENRLKIAQREASRLQERLKSAEAEVQEYKEQLQASQRGDADQLRNLQRENAALQQKLTLSEHRVRAKETEMERLLKKLEAETRHSTAQRERTRTLFREVVKRDPRTNSQADQKLLDIVEGFETKQHEMNEERDLLNAEIRRLNKALEDRENELNGSRASSLEEIERSLIRKARDAELDQRVSREALEKRERAIISKLSKLEGQLAEARRAEQRSQDHVENLKLELASRPTMRDWKASQHRIAKLESQVQSAVEALEEQEIAEARRNNIFVPESRRHVHDGVTGGGGFEGPRHTFNKEHSGDHLTARDRVELMAKRAMAETENNRRNVSTAELIRRDKLNHRLGLSKLTSLPKTAAHEILQDVCRVLELSDVHMIVPALQKMCWVVRAMPRLEKFTKDVSSFVLLHGDELTQQTTDDISGGVNPTSTALQAILPQLKRWVNDVRTVSVWRKFREDLLHELSRAPSMAFPSGNPMRNRQSCDMTNDQIVQAVGDLVSLERGMMDHQAAFRAADEYLLNNPDALMARAVSHFQQLFELRSVEGVLPKMNELYVYTNEMRNFMQVVRPTLGLGPQASVHACLAKLQELTMPSSSSQRREASSMRKVAETEDDADVNMRMKLQDRPMHSRLRPDEIGVPQWVDTSQDQGV